MVPSKRGGGWRRGENHPQATQRPPYWLRFGGGQKATALEIQKEKEMTFLMIRCLILPLGQAGTFTQWGLR